MTQRILNIFKASALAAAAAAMLGASASAQVLPAAGHPGCYAKIAYPPVYRTVTRREPGPPVVRYRDVPPVIEHYRRRVLLAPARTERQTIAPVYRTAWRWIEVPGPDRQVVSPPIYRTLNERRLISPARLEWRPGGAAHGFASNDGYGQTSGWSGGLHVRATGEVLCRVMVPARYALIRRRVMVSPARRTTIHCARRHVRVHERVLVRPGRTVRHVIAAIYRTVDCTRVVRPASRQRILTPGPMRLVSRRVLAGPQRYGWAPIVCAPRPNPRPVQSYGGGSYGAQTYGAPTTPVQTSGGVEYGATTDRSGGRAYGPNDAIAPGPSHPATVTPPLVSAPYDIGHPARR